MKISDSLLHTHQHYSDDWLYNTISRLIALINQKKEQLQNESLLEFSIRRTESTTILARYDGIQERTIYNKIKKILFRNSFYIVIYEIIESALQLANLLMLDLFTDSVKEGNKYYILYLIILLVQSLLKTYITSIQTHQIGAFLGKIDVICNTELYKKLLTIHSSQKDDTPNINTLITNDIEQIKQLHFSIKEGTLAIVMLVGCILFLYLKDVHAGNVILIVIICAQVFNFIVTSVMMKAQERMLMRKDQRISLTQDVLHGIKQIKYLSWEEIFSNKIMFTRKLEFQMLIVAKIFDGILVLFWNNINYILLFFYIMNTEQNLIDLNVFTLIAIFNSMIYPLGILPFCINFLFSALVSIKRVNNYFNLESVTKIEQNQIFDESEISIQLDNGTYKLSDDFTLEIQNLQIKKNTLNLIIGPIGSGKSTLFNAILNELSQLKEDKKQINGTISFCSQNSWIQNLTIRENICFGKEYDAQYFNNIVELCQLKEDIAKFQNFDQYLVGPDGNNLSGGQKQRIALARAIYQNTDIYLFDDVFSSLDIPVADQIFQNLILDYLKNKTVLFITSNQYYIQKFPKYTNIYYVEAGKIEQKWMDDDTIMRKLSKNSEDIKDEDQKQEKVVRQNDDLEERESGEVDVQVWKFYFSSMAWPLISLYLLFNFSLQGVLSCIDFWLKKEKYDDQFSSTFTKLLLLALCVTLLRAFFYVLTSLRSAWKIFENLNTAIMKAQMVFFDKTNSGRIINRVSGDIETIDGLLPWSFDIFLEALARGSGFVIGLIILFPFISLGLIVIFYAYYYVASTYVKTNRELKRLKQVNHAELLGWVNESQKGIKTIRAFQKQNHFFSIFQDKLKIWNTCEQTSLRSKFWYFVRLNLTCNLLLFVASFLILISNESQQSKSLALTYSILILDNFNELFNFYLQAEQMMISVERVRQYLKIGQEDIKRKNTIIRIINYEDSCDLITKPIVDLESEIEFKNICLSYDQQHYQLKNLSLQIKKKEKIAIVGRTGSGKTSIMNVLFQLYQQQTGDILIKGQNIKYQSLEEVRQQLSIVPQFGFLFQGTLIENLDPTNSIDVTKIQMLLTQFNQLKPDLYIEQGGQNLSNGEKQLINYLRIILQDKSIICLDEATSNIDPETDKFLHEFLFKFVENRTLIVITHRMDYVHHFDKVIQMKDGELFLEKQ